MRLVTQSEVSSPSHLRYTEDGVGSPNTVHSCTRDLKVLPAKITISFTRPFTKGGVLSSKVQEIYSKFIPKNGFIAVPGYAGLLLAAVAAKVGDVAIGILSLPLLLIYEPFSFIVTGTLSDRIRQMERGDRIGEISSFTWKQLDLFCLQRVFDSTQHALVRVYASIRYLTPGLLLTAGRDLFTAGAVLPVSVFLTAHIIGLSVFKLSLTAALPIANQLGIELVWCCFAKTLGFNGHLKTETSEYRIFTCPVDPNAPEFVQHSIEDEKRMGSSLEEFINEEAVICKYSGRVLTFHHEYWI